VRYVFGYGSLVNHRTHRYADTRAASLKGWRRVWRPTRLSEAAFLSARPAQGPPQGPAQGPAQGSSIRGVIAAVPVEDWAALDERETGYDRHDITTHLDRDMPGGIGVEVYAVADRHHAPERPGHVLLSYLDVVVQGFLQHYGDAGAEHFFATTDDWPAVVVDDRHEPRYPRHQSLTEAERAAVDRHLSELDVRVERPG